MGKLVLFEDEHFIIDMVYARTDNMLQHAVYEEIGFKNKAYMHEDMVKCLLSIVPILEKENLKMRICDAYRPPLAHKKMLEIVPIRGFFAADYTKSNHCHGTAVDVCLTDIDGNNLEYPTNIDAYEPHFAKEVCLGRFENFQKHLEKARHDYEGASKKALENRRFLKNLMEEHGFLSIDHEWWHYNLKGFENYPVVEWDKEKGII